MFARLREGEEANRHLLALLRGSALDNLFETHPPFQIDGNFGGTAGIASRPPWKGACGRWRPTEMPLQSHAGEIALLPALPTAWPEGTVRGLRARCGFTVHLAWAGGRLREAVLTSALGGECVLRAPEQVVVGDREREVAAASRQDGAIRFATVPGERHVVRPAAGDR